MEYFDFMGSLTITGTGCHVFLQSRTISADTVAGAESDGRRKKIEYFQEKQLLPNEYQAARCHGQTAEAELSANGCYCNGYQG
jgi:hypothetical protein